MQATFNFANQTFGVALNGAVLSFTPAGGGSAVTSVPFRNTFGNTVSLAEYGFQASFNTSSGITVNNAFFDNYAVTAAPVPEPSSLLLVGACALAAGWRLRRRKVAGVVPVT